MKSGNLVIFALGWTLLGKNSVGNLGMIYSGSGYSSDFLRVSDPDPGKRYRSGSDTNYCKHVRKL